MPCLWICLDFNFETRSNHSEKYVMSYFYISMIVPPFLLWIKLQTGIYTLEWKDFKFIRFASSFSIRCGVSVSTQTFPSLLRSKVSTLESIYKVCGYGRHARWTRVDDKRYSNKINVCIQINPDMRVWAIMIYVELFGEQSLLMVRVVPRWKWLGQEKIIGSHGLVKKKLNIRGVM